MELVDFLKARLDEERAEAEKLPDTDDYHLEPWAIQWEETGEWNSYGYLRIAKARVLAEVEAKRGILAQYETVREQVRNPVSAENRQAARTEQGALGDVLRLLALPYANHADYDASWKP